MITILTTMATAGISFWLGFSSLVIGALARDAEIARFGYDALKIFAILGPSAGALLLVHRCILRSQDQASANASIQSRP